MRLDDDSFFGVQVPIIKQLGIKPDSMSGGDSVTAILPFTDENSNVHRTTSGPAIMALLDFSMAASVRAHAPLAYTVVTLDLSVKFIKPATSDLYAECHCESRGRSICSATGIVFDEKGDKVAIANGLFKLISV